MTISLALLSMRLRLSPPWWCDCYPLLSPRACALGRLLRLSEGSSHSRISLDNTATTHRRVRLCPRWHSFLINNSYTYDFEGTLH